jgi:hypothetical protein
MFGTVLRPNPKNWIVRVRLCTAIPFRPVFRVHGDHAETAEPAGKPIFLRFPRLPRGRCGWLFLTEVDVLRSVFSGGLAFALAVGVVQAQSGSTTPADLLKDPAVKAAVDAAKANEAQTIADQIRFCEIPAPSFKEEVRGRELQRVFTQLGLQNVRVDKVGNVLGDYAGAAPRPHLVLAAHLDTVFPEGTDVKVKREGAVLKGPGIGDDCRGLGVMVAIIREMK